MVERDFFNSSEFGFFHICTDGNALDWMFKDDLDFIHGVNRLGICVFTTGVNLVTYVLMDNHIHLLLHGTMPQCKEFINKYKHLTGKYIYSQYAIEGALRKLPAKIIPIKDEEQLLATIAYIDRNSIVSGYRCLPTEYPWGSARWIFNDNDIDKWASGETPIPLGTIPVKKQRLILGSRKKLPQDWTIFRNGMLYPINFLETGTVERIFKTPSRYLYFLSKKLEGEIDSTITQSKKSFIPDKELRVTVSMLAQEMFGCRDVHQLNIPSRIAIARKLRYGFATSTKQIARMLHLNHEILKGYI